MQDTFFELKTSKSVLLRIPIGKWAKNAQFSNKQILGFGKSFLSNPVPVFREWSEVFRTEGQFSISTSLQSYVDLSTFFLEILCFSTTFPYFWLPRPCRHQKILVPRNSTNRTKKLSFTLHRHQSNFKKSAHFRLDQVTFPHLPQPVSQSDLA